MPPNQSTEPSHYTKRFTIYAKEYEFINSQNSWVTPSSSSPMYNNLVSRLKKQSAYVYNVFKSNERKVRIGEFTY